MLADGATLVVTSEAPAPTLRQWAHVCCVAATRALVLSVECTPLLTIFWPLSSQLQPVYVLFVLFWLVWAATVPPLLDVLGAWRRRVRRELRIDGDTWRVRTLCDRGASERQRELFKPVSGDTSELLGARVSGCCPVLVQWCWCCCACLTPQQRRYCNLRGAVHNLQVAAAGFEEGELRLALELHYSANAQGALDGGRVVTVFLQRGGAVATPSLADLEHAAQAINLHLESEPFCKSVALENDLFVTPFGTPPCDAPAPLDDVAAADAAAADDIPTFAAVRRAALPWHMAPTLPVLPSRLRVSRAKPQGGAVNTFVSLRGPPPRGLRVACAGAAVCLAVTGSLLIASRRGLVGHAYVVWHAFWLSTAVAGLAAVVALFDTLGAPERQYSENGVELWSGERWRLRWGARVMPGQFYKWRYSFGGGWWLHHTGSMQMLLGAKVRLCSPACTVASIHKKRAVFGSDLCQDCTATQLAKGPVGAAHK